MYYIFHVLYIIEKISSEPNQNVIVYKSTTKNEETVHNKNSAKPKHTHTHTILKDFNIIIFRAIRQTIL